MTETTEITETERPTFGWEPVDLNSPVSGPEATPGEWTLFSKAMPDTPEFPYFEIRAGAGFYHPKDGKPSGFGVAGIMTEADARLMASARRMFVWIQNYIDNSECSCEDWMTTKVGEKCDHCQAVAIVSRVKVIA